MRASVLRWLVLLHLLLRNKVRIVRNESSNYGNDLGIYVLWFCSFYTFHVDFDAHFHDIYYCSVIALD